MPAWRSRPSIAPFVFFYQMSGRLSAQSGTWAHRFGQNLFNLNQFVIPAVVLAVAIVVLRLAVATTGGRRAAPRRGQRRHPARADGMGPDGRAHVIPALRDHGRADRVPGHRLGARPRLRFEAGADRDHGRSCWRSHPGPAPHSRAWRLSPVRRPDGAFVRPELTALVRDVFRTRRDPNRLVVEWLRQHAQPTDEILINYEDLPLMYYLPNPIRGGVAAFRAEDDAKTPPRFAILRRSVPFVHWPVFQREISSLSVGRGPAEGA